MATLLLISTPGGRLTYEDFDIVDCMEPGLSPGKAVEANEGGHWSFIYITDKTYMETMMLRSPLTSGEGEAETQVAKRKFCCVLPPESAETCKTFRKLEDAPAEQKFTWAEFEASLCVDKDGGA
jgi:hypothetical protein